jgi:LytS/YehU family sensor histidine kinase
VAIEESLVFTIIFSILGIGLWFMVQFSGRIQRGWMELISYHLAAMAVTILIWLGTGSLVMKLISGNDSDYMDFMVRSLTFRVLSGILIYLLLLAVYYLMLSLKELKERMEREASLTSLLREAEINKLRAQIKPHFLFNSLNSVSSLTLTDPAKAQEMVIKLSEFMRYSLSMAEESMSTLKNELYHVGLYLDIEKVRFSDRLVISESIDPACENLPIPAMILQPLLENAVKHGVYTQAGPSLIKIEVKCVNEYLEVVISNDFDPETLPRKGTGTGLQNVIRRMATIYNRQDLVQIVKKENFFIVTLKLPVTKSRNN